MSKYDDIINLPRYEIKHKRMSIEARSAQFAPFSALTGYEDEVRETGRITENKIELSDEQKEKISYKLQFAIDNKEKVIEKSVIEVKKQVDYRVPLFTSAVCIRGNDCKNCKGGIKRYELKKDGRKYEAISKDCMVSVFRV